MQVRLNGKSVDAFGKSRLALGANRFPDFLLFAGGKVTTSGDRVKYRVEWRDENDRLKKWWETVEYTDPGGGPMGNLFDGGLVRKDDLSGDGFDVIFKIAGQDAQYVGYLEFGDETTPLIGYYLVVGDGGANFGITGLMLMQ